MRGGAFWRSLRTVCVERGEVVQVVFVSVVALGGNAAEPDFG